MLFALQFWISRNVIWLITDKLAPLQSNSQRNGNNTVSLTSSNSYIKSIVFTFHEITSFILFCVPSSFGQSAKKFRWMLNGIRPFSFIRLITWKYIRLSFALLCFFFGIFLGLNAENAFVTFVAGSSVCAFQMWTFVAACCSNFTYLSTYKAADVNFISHANGSCHIGPFFSYSA